MNNYHIEGYEERERRINELFGPEFLDKYSTDSLTRHVIKMLISGCKEIDMIRFLLVERIESQKIIEEAIKMSSGPKYIVKKNIIEDILINTQGLVKDLDKIEILKLK